MHADNAGRERIDWSQLWYPGPTRRFTDEELARAGGDRPNRSFIVILAINMAIMVQALLQLAPGELTARLTGLVLAFAVMGWQGCMALWRRPSRKRLNWALGLAALTFIGFALGFKWRVPDRQLLDWLFYTMAALLFSISLGFWFVAVFRAHQISARLTELDERERADAMRSQLLQAQIQPHFLFNSLASLQHWVEQGDARAAPMLGALTGFLRTSLPLFNRQQLTLGEELAAVRQYLAVMQARLGERLQAQIEVPEPLLDATLPPALLLTLVENAMEHGVVPQLGQARLHISAGQEGQVLRITVSDNGPGLTEQPLPQTPGRGVGLANSRLRLTQAYGPDARLTLANAPEGGCIATLSLPLTPAVAAAGSPHHA